MVRRQFLRHEEPLCKTSAALMLSYLTGETPGLHWQRVPGQSQVVGNTLAEYTGTNMAKSPCNPVHKQIIPIPYESYPQITIFCQNSSLSFLMPMLCCPTVLIRRRLGHLPSLPWGKFAILLCRTRVFRGS